MFDVDRTQRLQAERWFGPRDVQPWDDQGAIRKSVKGPMIQPIWAES